VTPLLALLARLAPLGLLTVVVQLAGVTQISVLGGSADVTPLVVASAGLVAGSMAGAVFGFGVGLFVDMALLQTPGVSSLLLLTVGYWSGRLRELRDPDSALVPLAVGAVAAGFYAAGFSLMQFLLGVDAPVSYLLLRQILVVTLIGALLALPVHALVRRVLEPALPDDPRRRRRRAYTTGGLSPLTRMR
jgi:cell shape-determining protein MreD